MQAEPVPTAEEGNKENAPGNVKATNPKDVITLEGTNEIN